MSINKSIHTKPEFVSYQRPLVAIIGRPNVGKSTLFNRFSGSRISITDDLSGVTRDKIYCPVEWSGKHFTLIDTGGYVPNSTDEIESSVRIQVSQALQEADVVVQVVDCKIGLTDLDIHIANIIRASNIPKLLAVNKADSPLTASRISEYYSLGLGEPFTVSAATGRKSGDLLDAILDKLISSEQEVENTNNIIRISLAGRPNVGKSTFINSLAGRKISIVNENPGTTRDTTHVSLKWKDNLFQVMDTAGLRKRSRVDDQIEYYSGQRALNSIGNSDVVIVLIDLNEGFVQQEARIMESVISMGSSMVIAVNKWDLKQYRPKGGASVFRDELYRRYPFVKDYPVVFVSGLTGSRINHCLETVERVGKNRKKRITTSSLNKILQKHGSDLTTKVGNRPIRLLYATQHSINPPTFTIFSNSQNKPSYSFMRHFENCLRKEFTFEGTPIRILWRNKKQKD